VDSEGVSLPGQIGAPGGSILVDKLMFTEVGGFDNELFSGYSPEDRFFWNKLSLFTTVISASNPPIELFHMNHPRALVHKDLHKKHADCCAAFDHATLSDQLAYLTIKRQLLLANS
jgi:hypothetical protein